MPALITDASPTLMALLSILRLELKLGRTMLIYFIINLCVLIVIDILKCKN